MGQPADSNIANDSPGLIAAFLADSDARCPACRYALRGCTSDKCPECGCELALAIAGARGGRVPMWWYAAAYGCGVAVFLSLVMLARLLQKVLDVLENPNLPGAVSAGRASMNDLPRWSSIFMIAILCALTGLLLAWVLRQRREFGRWPAAKQVMIGAVCWLSPVLMLAAIAMVTR